MRLVFQEITINPSLSVAENIFAGELGRFRSRGLLNQTALRRAAQELLDTVSADISVSQPLSRLDLGQWKCIEVARALSTRPSAVLFDESTAFLNHREVDRLLDAMRALRSQGLTVAFVSHHLAEIGAIADRLTILKDGRKVGDFAAGELDRDGIQSRMVGRDLSQGLYPPKAATPGADTILRFDDVACDGLEASTLKLAPGRDPRHRRPQGRRWRAYPRSRRRRRPALLRPHDARRQPLPGALAGRRLGQRHRLSAGRGTAEGLIVDASVLDNLVMARPPRRGPFFDRAKAGAMAAGPIRRLQIKTSSANRALGLAQRRQPAEGSARQVPRHRSAGAAAQQLRPAASMSARGPRSIDRCARQRMPAPAS